MKKDFSTRPDKFVEQWPGELSSFAWEDFVTCIPASLFLMTSWKSNGKENACLQSWSAFRGVGGSFICIISSMNTEGHAYAALKETGCCVLNFPSRDVYDKVVKTIENNQWEADEITASGLMAEAAICVNAPRVADCFLNIECEFLWEHPTCEEGGMTVALKAVNVSMDSEYFDETKKGRFGKTGYMYNVHSPRNPETGEIEPECFGALELYE